ncbi:hypothetical protein BY996DRAFT_6410697 [Phakopsora pachyrhizi]|nr:hypothetical protein BY996DRAFT_6410697 [Phakopsora pachyrhizi]
MDNNNPPNSLYQCHPLSQQTYESDMSAFRRGNETTSQSLLEKSSSDRFNLNSGYKNSDNIISSSNNNNKTFNSSNNNNNSTFSSNNNYSSSVNNNNNNSGINQAYSDRDLNFNPEFEYLPSTQLNQAIDCSGPAYGYHQPSGLISEHNQNFQSSSSPQSFRRYSNSESLKNSSIYPGGLKYTLLPTELGSHPQYHHASPAPLFSNQHSQISSPPSPFSPNFSAMSRNPHLSDPSNNRQLPSPHQPYDLLAEYSPPGLRRQFYPEPVSVLSSVDEMKNSTVDGSMTNLKAIPKESFDLSNSHPPISGKAGPGARKKSLLRGYRRLGVIAITGFLLISAALVLVIFINRRRVKHDSQYTGGNDGDVVSQSGLGSARNTTLDGDGADPFNSSFSGSDDGLRGGSHGYDSLIVFGASYCDNAHSRPLNFKNSLKPPPYFKGRWTNGYGSATVDNNINGARVPDLQQQINAFVSDLGAQSLGAGPSTGKSLIAIWVGINSVTKIWDTILNEQVSARTQAAAQQSLIEAQTHINSTVDRLFGEVSNLIKSAPFRGAPPDLLMLPIPPAQMLLVNIRSAKGNAGSLRTLANLNDLFNSRFAERLHDFQSSLTNEQNIFTIDIPLVWHQFEEQPASAGLSVVDRPCITKEGVCSDPNSYLFWDTLHPTTHIHQLLATMMKDAIRA